MSTEQQHLKDAQAREDRVTAITKLHPTWTLAMARVSEQEARS